MKIKFDIQMFAASDVVNTTVGYTNANTQTNTPYPQNGGLTNEMRTYYSDYLIDMAEPKLVHDQFGQKHPIPQNGGKTIEFRKYDPLPKMTTPLLEGVTPTGQKLSVSTVSAEVKQYGGYVELSDILMLAAIDNNLVQATKLLGGQAGRTLDTITREIISGGTNVQYSGGEVSSRSDLVGGSETEADNHYLTVDAIRKAVRYLKKMNAETINGSFVGIIHPDVAYDLMNDPKWVNVKTYSDPEGIYKGEIGKIENVRFVESSEAKIFHANALTNGNRNLTAKSYSKLSSQGSASESCGSGSLYKIVVSEALSSSDADSLVDRKIMVKLSSGNYEKLTVTGFNTTDKALFVSKEPSATISDGDIIYPGDAAKDGRDVYSTLILGENAYGTTEIEGGGLTHIVKQLGSAGTADPLNQRATAGWKATKAAARLVEPYMVRIETTSTFTETEDN